MINFCISSESSLIKKVQMRNGEPIYQNVPLRNVQPAAAPQSTSINQQGGGTPTRKKWGLHVISSQRSRNSARSAVINSSSPVKKSLVAEPAPFADPTTTVVSDSASSTVKDHLVSIDSSFIIVPFDCNFFNFFNFFNFLNFLNF